LEIERSQAIEVEVLDQLSTDIRNRIYANEDDGMILGYLTSDDVSESIRTAIADSENSIYLIDPKIRSWWRLFAAVSGLFAPAKQEFERITKNVEIAMKVESDMDEEKADDILTEVDHEDVLTLIKDGISRYKAVIFGVISKDAYALDDSSETLVGAELFILEQLKVNTIYSRSTLEGCLHSLLLHKCVQMENVLKWLLDDVNSIADEKNICVFLRWWEIATSSMKFYIYEIIMRKSQTNESMSIEDGIDSTFATAERAKKIIEFLEPLLSYSIHRVCQLLTLITSQDAKSTKLTPNQVDLVEGVKYLIVDSHSIFLSCLQDKNTSRSTLKVLLAESPIAAAKLLATISNDSKVDSPAVDILRRSIQRL
jgi:hypothetical protein